jgi:DNA-directed RNA polymerase II subunit RPB2
VTIYGNIYGRKVSRTIGLTLPASDMPFSKNGIVPDIIMNPNAFPKRMTCGQFIEHIAAKIGATLGYEIDATTFGNADAKEMNEIVKELGYEEYGTEELYNGMNGKKMKVKIYIGPTYYMRLKHMVADKMHGRARGPRTQLTKQALEGLIAQALVVNKITASHRHWWQHFRIAGNSCRCA